MRVKLTDNIMRPYLHVGDKIEFEKGDPIPDGQICPGQIPGTGENPAGIQRGGQ